MEIAKPEWLAQMQGILEVLNEGVIVTDDCERFIYANQQMLEMVGLPPEKFLGRTPADFYAGEDLQFVLRQREKGLRLGHNRVEFFVPGKGAARIPVVMSARVLEDLEGREFTILTLTDISEQKRIEQQLREANEQLAQRQREIDFELSLAERVQQSLAPQSLRWGRTTVETAYQPVRSIGGDFGMVLPHGEDALTVMVCDVSGHGISSALIANRIYTETVSLLERGAELGDMLHDLNQFVLQHIRTTGFYFTMAVARLEAHGRRLSYAGAGHPPAIYATSAGDSRVLMPRNAVLGLLEDAVDADPVEHFELQPGERFVLYTDGLTEAFNVHDEEFGADRLRETLRRQRAASLLELKQAILDGVTAWRHGPPADDLSLVLIEVN